MLPFIRCCLLLSSLSLVVAHGPGQDTTVTVTSIHYTCPCEGKGILLTSHAASPIRDHAPSSTSNGWQQWSGAGQRPSQSTTYSLPLHNTNPTSLSTQSVDSSLISHDWTSHSSLTLTTSPYISTSNTSPSTVDSRTHSISTTRRTSWYTTETASHGAHPSPTGGLSSTTKAYSSRTSTTHIVSSSTTDSTSTSSTTLRLTSETTSSITTTTAESTASSSTLSTTLTTTTTSETTTASEITTTSTASTTTTSTTTPGCGPSSTFQIVASGSTAIPDGATLGYAAGISAWDNTGATFSIDSLNRLVYVC